LEISFQFAPKASPGKHGACSRIGVYDCAVLVKYHHPGRHGRKQMGKALRQGFFFQQLAAQFAVGDGQFGGKSFDLLLQVLIGAGELLGCEIEQRECLFQFLWGDMFGGSRQVLSLRQGKVKASYNKVCVIKSTYGRAKLIVYAESRVFPFFFEV